MFVIRSTSRRCRSIRRPGTRIAIANANVPTVLNQILAVLSERKINVIDMINKSREQLAYTLIDIEAEPEQVPLEQFEMIDSVINVRVIVNESEAG